MQLEASVIGGAHSGTVETRTIWQNHYNRLRNEEVDEDGRQYCCDYDDDNKDGFRIDVGTYL